MWLKLKRLMRIQQTVAGAGWPVYYGVLGLFLTLLGVNLWYWWRKPTAVSLRVEPPIEVRLPQEKRRVARQGLIVVASLYTPQAGNKAQQLSPAERLAAAQRGDYGALDFAHSNFAPLIEAVLTYESRLRRR